MPVSTNIYLPLQFNQLVELIRQLPKKKKKQLIEVLLEENENDEPNKKQILDGIREAVEQVKLHKQGKIKLKTAQQLLNEL